MFKRNVWVWSTAFTLLGACSWERETARLVPAVASLQLALDSGPRRLQQIEAGDAVRLSVMSIGSAEAPFRAELNLNDTQARIDNVPVGERKVVTLEWLDSKKNPMGQVRLSHVMSIHGGVNNVRLNDLSTATAAVYEALKRNNAPDADTFDLVTMRYVVEDATRQLGLVTPRQIVAERVAAAITGKSSKDLPKPASDWAVGVATVNISFDDYPKGLLTRLTLDDGASRSVYVQRGEPFQFYPVLAGSIGRTLTITPLEKGPDWQEIQASLEVGAGSTVSYRVPSFVKSQPGVRLPVRLGRGMGLTMSDGLWVIGGVSAPSDEPGAVPAVTRVAQAQQAWRFNREQGWKSVINLPNNFPIYGAGFSAIGNKIHFFGGYLNEAVSRKWGIIEQKDTGNVVIQGDLPANFSFTDGVCGRIGSTLFLTGFNDRSESVMARFNIETGAFDGDVVGGPRSPVNAAATGVVGNKLYAIGGYLSALAPVSAVQVLDPAIGQWRSINGMPTPRYGAASVVLNDKIWVIGGEEARGVASHAVEVYDPATDTWTRRAPLKIARSYPAAGLVKLADAERIVVAGGVLGDSPDGYPWPIDEVEELIP